MSYFKQKILIFAAAWCLAFSSANAQCDVGDIAVLSASYEINDEYTASLQNGPNKPEGIRGIERRDLILSKDMSRETSYGRFWRFDEVAYQRETEEVKRKMLAGEAVASLPQHRYREEIEDKVIITSPEQIVYFDRVNQHGFIKSRDEEENFFSEPEARSLIRSLAQDISNKTDARVVGENSFAEQTCQMVKVTKPFVGEFCYFTHGIHTVVLYENFISIGQHRYVQKVTELDVDVCVSPSLFAVPAELAEG